MDTRSIQKTIKTFIQQIPKRYILDDIIVFGSRVKGNKNNKSDIDVVVVSKAFSSLSENKRLSLLYRASAFLIPEIHPWGITPKEFNKSDPQTTLGKAKSHGVSFSGLI